MSWREECCEPAHVFAVGSPQSKEGTQRAEEKLDWIMRRLDAEHAERRINELEPEYPKA